VHDINSLVCPEKTKELLFFDAFTGCREVSAFRGKEKKSACQTVEVGAEASDICVKQSKFKSTVGDHELKIIVKFLVTMYDRSCTVAGVNVA